MVLPNKFKIAFKIISASVAGIFLFSLTFSFIFAGSVAIAKTDQGSPDRAYSPFEIRKTNIKDTKFTISWRTLKNTGGSLMYGDAPSCEQVAFDDRGKNLSAKLHYITVRNLNPNTVYYYKIISENKAYQNNDQPFNLTTGSSIMATGSDVAYGRVYGRKNMPYTDSAIVYLTLRDKDGAGSQGFSSPVSVLTDRNGYWSYELKNFREENLDTLFTYSDVGDALAIEVQIESSNNAISLEVDTRDDSPVKDIVVE